MANATLTPRTGLEGEVILGRAGLADGDAGVTISLRSDVALATIIARKGQEQAVAERVRQSFGLELPQPSRWTAHDGLSVVSAGPGIWLARRDGVDGHAFLQQLRNALTGLASISDQSDGRTLVRVSGLRARDTLAKGVMLDLHPDQFQPGHAAVTSVAHIGVHFWQVDDAPTYEFAVFRSYAGSFLHWLSASAAEFGIETVA